MSKPLTAEEKEAKKQAAAEKAARNAEEKVAAEEAARKEAEEQASREAAEKAAAEEEAAREAEEKAAAEEAARKQAEEKAARDAEEQAAAEEAARKQAEEKAKTAGAGAEAPPSPATSYANTADDKAQRDAQAEKDKKGNKQPADAKAAELKAKGLQILADYPAEHTVYMTANGFGFFKRADARNHADTLSDTEVLTVNKE